MTYVYALVCTDPKGWTEYDEIFGPNDQRLFESREKAEEAGAAMIANGDWKGREPPEYAIRTTTLDAIFQAADEPDGDEELAVLAGYMDLFTDG